MAWHVYVYMYSMYVYVHVGFKVERRNICTWYLVEVSHIHVFYSSCQYVLLRINNENLGSKWRAKAFPRCGRIGDVHQTNGGTYIGAAPPETRPTPALGGKTAAVDCRNQEWWHSLSVTNLNNIYRSLRRCTQV